MTVTETITESVGETVESIELPAVLHQFPLEPRCRVCRNDRLRTKVNDMLATGVSYAMILRALQKENDQLDIPDRVTIDSIRNHTTRHFPVQNVARATYRAILERRAQENGVDFVQGVATAITPMAFYETVMAKGYETLVDSDTTVDVNAGMIAAARLQARSNPGPAEPASPTCGCRWVASSTPSTPACQRSCGRKSCARSMDLSRRIHRGMTSKIVTTRRTSTRQWEPRRQTRAAGLCARGEPETRVRRINARCS